jgi:hypothetical protein
MGQAREVPYSSQPDRFTRAQPAGRVADRLELGVRRRVAARDHAAHALSDDAAVFHDHRAVGLVATLDGQPAHLEGARHELFPAGRACLPGLGPLLRDSR